MKRARRFVELLRTQPDYVFGRFLFVRRLYSVARRVAGPAMAASLKVGRIYESDCNAVTVGPSGFVESAHPVDTHVARLHDTAWSNEICLTTAAVTALGDLAQTTRLMFQASPERVEFAPSLDSLSPERRNGIALAQVADGWQDPTVAAIAGDEQIVAVVSKYLGYAPTRASVFFFWSFASALSQEERIARNQTVLFHYDVDGYNFVYVSFYLVDVDRDGGAHSLIERTHQAKRLGHLLGTARLSDEAAEAAFGRESIVTIEAPAGSGFFEDTSCYHKALVPTERDRLMIQFRYQ